MQTVIQEKDLVVGEQVQRELQAATQAATEEQGREKSEFERQKELAIKRGRTVNFNDEVDIINTEKQKPWFYGNSKSKKLAQQSKRPKLITAPATDHFKDFLASQFVSLPKEQSKAL